jgi:hypothetical protein
VIQFVFNLSHRTRQGFPRIKTIPNWVSRRLKTSFPLYTRDKVDAGFGNSQRTKFGKTFLIWPESYISSLYSYLE